MNGRGFVSLLLKQKKQGKISSFEHLKKRRRSRSSLRETSAPQQSRPTLLGLVSLQLGISHTGRPRRIPSISLRALSLFASANGVNPGDLANWTSHQQSAWNARRRPVVAIPVMPSISVHGRQCTRVVPGRQSDSLSPSFSAGARGGDD